MSGVGADYVVPLKGCECIPVKGAVSACTVAVQILADESIVRGVQTSDPPCRCFGLGAQPTLGGREHGTG